MRAGRFRVPLASLPQYVVDASRPGYAADAIVDLLELLSHADVVGKPVLVVATKCDVDGALSLAQLDGLLGLTRIFDAYQTLCDAVTGGTPAAAAAPAGEVARRRSVSLLPASARDDTGLEAVRLWLTTVAVDGR